MFRLFLMNKLANEMEKIPKSSLPKKQLRNRRIYERYTINHKHISLLNEQDILNVRDISESGFACEVGERCFKRLDIGDIYLAKLRYLGEIYQLKISVARKDKPFIGFSILEKTPPIEDFIKRIITPSKIASSLKLSSELPHQNTVPNSYEFYGDEESYLKIIATSSNEIESWNFVHKSKYAHWQRLGRIETGKNMVKRSHNLSTNWETEQKKDPKPSESFLQFCKDVFMALDFRYNDKLLETLEEKLDAKIHKIF